MMIKILAFGVAKDIVGGSEVTVETPEELSVGKLKDQLVRDFPDFAALRSLALAVNGEYATDDLVVRGQDEVVIIPPVSGG